MRHTGAVVFVLAVSAVRSTIAALLDLDALAIVTRETGRLCTGTSATNNLILLKREGFVPPLA
jgi:hypothetical protein